MGVKNRSLVVWLFLCACASHAPRNPEAAYREARDFKRAGNLRAARQIVEAALESFPASSRPPLYYKFRLLESELLADLGENSKAAALRDAAIPDTPELSDAIAYQLRDQAQEKLRKRDYEGARPLVVESAVRSRASGDRELMASIERQRGTVLWHTGRANEAEDAYRASLRLADETGDSRGRSLTYGGLGRLAMEAARYEECIGWFERALAESTAEDILAPVEQNLGFCYYSVGDLDHAISLFRQSERLSEKMGNPRQQQIDRGHIGIVDYDKGDLKAALSDYKLALDLARKQDDTPYVLIWLNNLAAISLDMRDFAAAEKYTAEAIRSPGDRHSAEGLWTWINSARIREHKGDLSEAEALYHRAAAANVDEPAPRLVARERLALLLSAQGRLPEAEAQFRSALDLVDASRAKLERDDSKLSYFSSVIRLRRDYVDFLFAHDRREDALLAADASRARLLAEIDGRAGASVESVGTLRRVAQRSGTILLSYWLAPKRSLLWVIAPSGMRSVVLPPENEIRALVESHARGIQDLRDPLDNSESPARKLYDALIAPVADAIPHGARVAIVPDGWLHDLNFETLVTGGEKPHYWIEDAAVCVIPSLGVLLRPAPAVRRTNSLLLIGDPVPADPKRFPRLENAAREIAGIHALFEGTPIVERTGEKANPGEWREVQPARFSIIHFAAHATANRESPLDSAVILSSADNVYKLYAREIVKLPIHARLVTISACRSAGARTYGGEGMVGFAWAFLKAGARDVVAGLWEVDDASTAATMERMYRAIHSGARPADALRAAKLEMLNSGGVTRKPYYWAPFQTFTASL